MHRFNRRVVHRRLAGYFEQGEPTRRSADEQVWGHSQAGDDTKLVEILADVNVLRLLYTDTGVNEVLRHWARLRDAGADVEQVYRRSLQTYAHRAGTEDRLEAYATVGSVLERLAMWQMATEVYERMVEESESRGNQPQMARAELLLGELHRLRGKYAEALHRLANALQLYQELDDLRGVALAQGNMGIVHSSRGEYDRALECYGVFLRISRQLGDRRGVANAHGNMGNVYRSRGEYDRALLSFEEHLRISRQLGDRRGVARAQGNMGIVYSNQGEHDRALQSHAACLRFCQELGDRSGAALPQGNMGIAYFRMGEYCQALESFTTAAATHRAIGYRHGLSFWLQGTPEVLLELLERHETMPEYLPRYVMGTDANTWREKSRNHARQAASECLEISRELSKPDTLFASQLLLARITAAEGDRQTAWRELERLLAETAGEAEHADCHYWLWKLGASGGDHRGRALRLYQTIFRKTPKHEYRKRIDELQGTAAPPTLVDPTAAE